MKRCIGTYNSEYGTALLYQVDYLKSEWITNICYEVPGTKRLYSPTMAHITTYARDHDGRERNSMFWNTYVTYSHDSYVLR
jgi:hypothetical protein